MGERVVWVPEVVGPEEGSRWWPYASFASYDRDEAEGRAGQLRDAGWTTNVRVVAYVPRKPPRKAARR